MRIINSLLVGIFSIIQVNSQITEFDTTYRPGKYPLIVEQYKSYPNSEKDIIFLGNSITAYTNWNELLRLPHARNRGISGDTTFGVLERLNEVTEGNPAKIFILIGINDISRNFPVPAILDNYNRIVHRIKNESPGTLIFVQTIMPVNNTFTKYQNHYNKDETISAVNKGIRKIALDNEVTLIDLHPHFLDDEGRLDKKYTEEGLHLNSKGYEKWASLLLPYVQK